MLAYLRNLEATRSGWLRDGILLYSEVGEKLRVDIQLKGLRIQTRTVDLGRDWRAIHNGMLETIGLVGPRA